MSGIARTSATGQGGMLPELLAWSSSLREDLALVREDLIGSAAHVTMLARTRIISVADARLLRDALRGLYDEACAGSLKLGADEEDVHMAVEAELGKRVGAVAARLHTARSRNDQVALDLRLHVRDQGVALVCELAALVDKLADRAAREKGVLLPAYTHRQRAQPVSAAFLVAAWAVGLTRAIDVVSFGLEQIEMPLGSGACSGSSLPIDRALVARLFAPWEPTRNALHTVGDRDFALDWTWGVARAVLALGRLASDVVDFSTSEFALVRLDGAIATGSSMMPQKKNPDVFELVRGKSARAVGNVVALLTLMKGLASGYNRDQQEDRLPLLEAGPLARGCAGVVSLAIDHVEFDGATWPASPRRGLHPGDGPGRGACPTRHPLSRGLQGGRGSRRARRPRGDRPLQRRSSARSRAPSRFRRRVAARARARRRGRVQGEPGWDRATLGGRAGRVAARPRSGA